MFTRQWARVCDFNVRYVWDYPSSSASACRPLAALLPDLLSLFRRRADVNTSTGLIGDVRQRGLVPRVGLPAGVVGPWRARGVRVARGDPR